MSQWRCRTPIKYQEDNGLEYIECEKTWEYGTVSDVLLIETKVGAHSDNNGPVPEGARCEYFGRGQALATLELLMDWAECYEGEGTIQKLLDKRLVAKEPK